MVTAKHPRLTDEEIARLRARCQPNPDGSDVDRFLDAWVEMPRVLDELEAYRAWHVEHEARQRILFPAYEAPLEERRAAVTEPPPSAAGPSCDSCAKPAEHAEHYFERVRFWCEAHTPWSGHHEHCWQVCRDLLVPPLTSSTDPPPPVAPAWTGKRHCGDDEKCRKHAYATDGCDCFCSRCDDWRVHSEKYGPGEPE